MGLSVRRLVGSCLTLLLLALSLGFLDSAPSLAGKIEPTLVLSEYMASNRTTLADRDGDYPDWVEIQNQGKTAAPLDGWYLTDNRTNRTKWRFPGVVLQPGASLVVFASGKNRVDPNAELHASFKLDRGGEYIALVEPNGKTIATEYSFAKLPQYADVSYGVDAAGKERYFTVPTPGSPNGSAPADLGPVFSQASHFPSLPTADDPLTVTARVSEALASVQAVTLHYRVMYEQTAALPMFDDGQHGDSAPGDGVYGAVIPKEAYRAGDMVRYRVSAVDAEGRTSHWPLFLDPANSPEYLGTVVADPGSSTLLPTLYWFVQDERSAETREGARASVFYDGVLYDNVFVRTRGFVSEKWPKKSFKFDFSPGHYFRFADGEAPVEEFNLNSTYNDRAYIRQILAWETYRDAGVPYCIALPMRVQRNGQFYGIFVFVEQPDKRYLARQGLDTNGALYKMKSGSPLDPESNNAQKVTRLSEDDSDLQDLIEGIHRPGKERIAYLFDHVNIPGLLNYQAVATIAHDRDQGYNNYYTYRDTEGTGEWTFLPWDKDLTFGLYHNEELDVPFTADQDPPSHPLASYKHNDLVDALYEIPVTREMFLRHLRTVMDEFLQPPETPVEERYYERRIDELFTQMQLDAALDAARWPDPQHPDQTFGQAIDELEQEYLAPRRTHLYYTHGPANKGIIPEAQPLTTTLRFGQIGFAPPESRDQEYLTLVNDNDYAVDISGWQIRGAVEHTFQPGVVIPAGGRLYVSPNVVAFRAREVSPKGGETLFVQGNYDRRLSDRGGMLWLYNTQDKLVASRLFVDRNLFAARRLPTTLMLLTLAAVIYRFAVPAPLDADSRT